MEKDIKLETFIDVDQLKKDLEFSEHNLTDAFQSQASLFAFYANMASKASFQEERLKQSRDIIEARLDMIIRTEASESGKKLTEPMIAKKIQTDRRYIKAQGLRLRAKMIHEMCKAACESFRHKRDMLIQSGSDAREEFKGEMRMREVVASSESKERRIQALKEAVIQRAR